MLSREPTTVKRPSEARNENRLGCSWLSCGIVWVTYRRTEFRPQASSDIGGMSTRACFGFFLGDWTGVKTFAMFVFLRGPPRYASPRPTTYTGLSFVFLRELPFVLGYWATTCRS